MEVEVPEPIAYLVVVNGMLEWILEGSDVEVLTNQSEDSEE